MNARRFAETLFVPLNRDSQQIPITITQRDFCENHGRQGAGLIQRFALPAQQALIFHLTQQAFQRDARATLNAKGTRNLSLAGLAGL